MSKKSAPKFKFPKWDDPRVNKMLEEMRQEGCSYIFDATKVDMFSTGPQPFIPVDQRNKNCGKKCVAKSLYCGAHRKLINARKKGCVYDMFKDGDICGDKCVEDTVYCKEHVCFNGCDE